MSGFTWYPVRPSVANQASPLAALLSHRQRGQQACAVVIRNATALLRSPCPRAVQTLAQSIQHNYQSECRRDDWGGSQVWADLRADCSLSVHHGDTVGIVTALCQQQLRAMRVARHWLYDRCLTVAVANKLDPGVRVVLPLATACTLNLRRCLRYPSAAGRTCERHGPRFAESRRFTVGERWTMGNHHKCAIAARLNETASHSQTLVGRSTYLTGRAQLSFSLTELPPPYKTQSSSQSPGLGLTIHRYRDFQRFETSEAEAPSTVAQVDHLRRSILVNGESWVAAGWYYSLFDNAETNLTDFLANQARMGMNTMMLYTFPANVPRRGMGGEADASPRAADAVGMKILMDIEQVTMPNVAIYRILTEFQKAILAVKDHPVRSGSLLSLMYSQVS